MEHGYVEKNQPDPDHGQNERDHIKRGKAVDACATRVLWIIQDVDRMPFHLDDARSVHFFGELNGLSIWSGKFDDLCFAASTARTPAGPVAHHGSGRLLSAQ